jgi:hypothetical protein
MLCYSLTQTKKSRAELTLDSDWILFPAARIRCRIFQGDAPAADNSSIPHHANRARELDGLKKIPELHVESFRKSRKHLDARNFIAVFNI